MATETYNPEQAAAAIGNVSASTIRNWCKVYDVVLSPGANPPLGTERRLTQQDVTRLQQIKVMRDNRRTVDEIVAALQRAATNEAVHITIDAPRTLPQNAQEAPESTLLLPAALSSMNERFAAIERRLDASAAEQRAHLHDRLWTLGLGILIGMIAMMALLFLAWLFVNVQAA
jgi:DNA-binding transcriptional MerR regulator